MSETSELFLHFLRVCGYIDGRENAICLRRAETILKMTLEQERL